MRLSRNAALAVVAVALVTSACAMVPKYSTLVTSTLPPLPPDVIALVTEIGQGAALGTVSSVYGVDLTGGASSGSKTFAVGTFPDAIATAPNGDLALVANYSSNTVTPIDLSNGKMLSSIAAGDGPAGIAITPDGKTAYVTDAGTSPVGTTITPINLQTRRALAPITVGAGPQGIAITPDGQTAWVALAGAVVSGQAGAIGSSVVSVNLATRHVSAPITVGNAPIAIAVSPDGSTVWVGNSYSGSVTPISTSSNSAGTPIAVTGAPDAIAVTPNGQTVFVADQSSSVAKTSNVTAIATSTGVASAPITVGKDPSALAITPDGTTVWVVCSGTGTLEPLAVSTLKPSAVGSVAVANGPYAVALVTKSHALVAKLFAIAKKK